MPRYEPQEKVWKQFSTWDEVKEYMNNVEKVINIDGVKHIEINYTNYGDVKIKMWAVSVELNKM